MTKERAPLYVEALDLATWLTRELDAEPSSRSSLPGLESDLARVGRELLAAVGIALTFPDRRHEALRAADESLVRLRLGLELAAAVGRLAPRQVRYASARVDRAGRMVGGWRRALRRRKTQGTKPTDAAGAPTA